MAKNILKLENIILQKEFDFFTLANIHLTGATINRKQFATAQEKAHLQSASPNAKPKIAKELFPALFSPPPKKNKFPTATPAYLQTVCIIRTAYNKQFCNSGAEVQN